MNYYNNLYDTDSNDRTNPSTNKSPYNDGTVKYRRLTNICKMCDMRCIKCTGPTNFECSECRNHYYKWTNATVCESYCPTGQYQLNITTVQPDNETKCANCDPKCISCEGYDYNCSRCTIFPNSNYAFLYTYVLYNTTCMVNCLNSTDPLTEKGFYGSIGTMTCHPCPGGCSRCNIDYLISQYSYLQSIVCDSDNYCTKGIICTACLQGYSLVGGTCVDQTTCRLYSYYVQGNSSTSWSPSNCHCLDGLYFSDSTTCSTCHILCETCNGSAASNCLTCAEGYVLSGTSCVNNQVKQKKYWIMQSSTLNTTGSVSTSDNSQRIWCGSYYLQFGYRSSFSTSSYISYSSGTFSTPNYYAISVKAKVLFIDQWESTAGFYFREGSTSAYPFHVYNYDNKGAIG